MARSTELDKEDRIRVLKALAFRIHRKVPLEEALAEVLDQESMGGRHRAFRPAKEALEAQGALEALLLLGLMGAEAAAVMAVVVGASDHRLLSGALSALAEFFENEG